MKLESNSSDSNTLITLYFDLAWGRGAIKYSKNKNKSYYYIILQAHLQRIFHLLT